METQIVLPNFYDISLVHMKGNLKKSEWNSITHSHDHFELSVHIKGNIQIFAENSSYLLSGGEIRLYGAGELHCGIVRNEEEMEWYQINIPQSFLSAPNGTELTRIFWDRKFGTKNVLHLQKQKEIVSMLESAFAMYCGGNPLALCLCQSIVVGILCLLGDSKGYFARDAVNKIPALEEILDMIHTEYATICTVADIARKTHFSVSYINKLFRAQVGVSPYQFLLEKKFIEAKKALKNGKSVTEAAEMAGFRDYSGFITLFKKRYGMTPYRYKN
jgi:AraC-like DNA-binding protein